MTATMSSLVFKRAAASRTSGEWREDDYDVLADGAVVGRIMKAAAVPVGMSWMWIRLPAIAKLLNFSIALGSRRRADPRPLAATLAP